MKKSNLESDVNKWKTLWLDEKSENDKKKVAFENKIQENQQLRYLDISAVETPKGTTFIVSTLISR